MHAGLDGIAIDLPALNLKPTHGDYIPMNIQIKDPIWPMRDMLDFSFSVKPGEPHTLWLDTRDRILPNDKSLYITIASASPEFGTDAARRRADPPHLQALRRRPARAHRRPPDPGPRQLRQHDRRVRQLRNV